jgi:hypothetical protein
MRGRGAALFRTVTTTTINLSVSARALMTQCDINFMSNVCNKLRIKNVYIER